MLSNCFFCLDDDTIGTYEHLISYTSLIFFLIFEKMWSAVHLGIETVSFLFFSSCVLIFCELVGVSLLLSSFYSENVEYQ